MHLIFSALLSIGYVLLGIGIAISVAFGNHRIGMMFSAAAGFVFFVEVILALSMMK